MQEEIVRLASALAGAEPGEVLEALCAAAEQGWLGRLRAGVTAADCGLALPCAAAFTAAADLAVSRGAGAVAAFTAGAVSVRERGAGEAAARAEALRETAERLMAPYATAADFAFRGVRG